MPNKLLLTFDVEDFINDESVGALHFILKLLKKHSVKALFFITGHMAEKLRNFQPTLNMLADHEIGFHSSAHSVHPTIFEYCDIENYDNAYSISLERETSHINPLSGEIEGPGGLRALRDLLPHKSIKAYRAPGHCCPPPNLEAMATLGIRYDFSWNFARVPVHYKGMTLYPHPVFPDCEKALLIDKNDTVHPLLFLRSICTAKMTLLNFHPDRLVNKEWWDGIYHNGNPSRLHEVVARNAEQRRRMSTRMETLLKVICRLEKLGVITTSPILNTSGERLDLAKVNVCKAVDTFTSWPRTFFSYKPKHLYPQFSRFFECDLGQAMYA